MTAVISQSIEIPSYFLIKQNYPNPFNGETNIIYSLPEGNFVELIIYDILGSEVITLVKDFHAAGEYNVTWNGNNSYGTPMPSGIYFYRITVFSDQLLDQSFHAMKRMIYLK